MRAALFALVCAQALAAPLSPADKSAAELLQASLAADPFADEPLAALGRIYERGPGRAALIDACRARAAAAPTQAGGWIVLGRAQLERGQRQDGLRSLQQALHLEKDPARLRRLARLFDDGGARADAITAYRGGLAGASPVEQRNLQLRLGALYLADNKSKEAQAAWQEAKRLAPNDVALRRQIAEALASRHAWHPALEELRALEPLLAQDPAAQVALSRRESELARRAGDRAGSVDSLVRGFVTAAEASLATQEAELARDLLHLYDLKPGKKPPAELLSAVSRYEAKHPAAAALRAEALARSGDVGGATSALHAALAARPGDVYLLRRLAALETGAARMNALRALFALQAGDAAVGLEYLGALLETKADEAAIVEVTRTLRQRFSGDALVLGEAARQLSKAGRHVEAEAIWERVTTLTPEDPDAWVAFADELHALGRDEEARRAYFHVAHDGSAVSYGQLITILDRRKLAPLAKQAWDEAVSHHPEDRELRQHHARWLSANGFPAEAIVEWKQLRESTKDPFLRDFADRELKRLEWQQMLERK